MFIIIKYKYMKCDLVIIGAGITGVSIAFELSKYNISVILVDKENDVSMGTTKANSGIIHAGYDPKPNTLMAKLNVEGNRIIKSLHKLLNFNYKEIGSLVIGSSNEDKEIINKLYKRGIENKVPDLFLLKSKKEVHQIEPNLNKDISYALLSKSAGIISPWELAISLAYTAVTNGVKFINNCKVESISVEPNKFILSTTKGIIESKYVFNAAGLYADDIYNMVLDSPKKGFTITPIKGEYYLLDKSLGNLVSKVVFQTPSSLGKGVLVSPTVHGNLLVGPNASFDISKDNVSTTVEGLKYIVSASKKSIDNINFFSSNIRNFSGNRATINGVDDFICKESEFVPNFYNFAGIKSPGLTSGPAIGKYAVSLLKQNKVKLVKKEHFKYHKLPTFLSHLSTKELEKKISENKKYGNIICRCELVSEGEIISSIKEVIPATSIDGVKRRTNAGMGRCQGSFCGPKVFQILKNELHLDIDKIYQDRENSNVVTSYTKGRIDE